VWKNKKRVDFRELRSHLPEGPDVLGILNIHFLFLFFNRNVPEEMKKKTQVGLIEGIKVLRGGTNCCTYEIKCSSLVVKFICKRRALLQTYTQGH
jgi:hypothetical protein